jgi:ABC-type glycerol-3-phosphate transport system permease component
MDIYEVGVYLVIIVVASICVFGIMWLLMKSMQPKRSRARRRVAAAATVAGGPAPKVIPQQSSDSAKDKKNNKDNKDKKNKKEKKKKEPKVREEKLLKLKELPDNRLLPQSESPAPSKDAPKEVKVTADKPSQESGGASTPVAAEMKQGETAAADAAEGQENADMTLPDLPSMDTLTEEDDTAPKDDPLDLMSVFETEDAEDSTTSDLAANLFDVDVQNIEKLGSEVSEFLGGMRSK